MKTRRELLEDFVAQDPDDPFSRYALALELEKEGNDQGAVPQLHEVIVHRSSRRIAVVAPHFVQ